ncbi:long-chain acyl-CoA synthetase [Apibacter mensalis]|uniref:Long-chain acyl-CoA synthetase n=1 Tax=Apibacter mensalis TaxID=1586267 RepID=A0A0X3ANI8_9FLAO|nr:long-chain fatty acid--CoA ligase [Apibacter mensalis]CVK15950.1 long-chain acyl-CoA synthetase [Apibacter mensalis]
MKVAKLFDILYYQLENRPIEVSISSKKNGIWEGISTKSVIDQVNQVSRGLLKYRIKPEDRIALITSVNRTEWSIMDFAIQQIGAVSVPIYPTISDDDLIFILNNSEAKFCFISDKKLYDKVQNIKDNCPSLTNLFTFDEIEGAPHWTEIKKKGEEDSNQHEVEKLKNSIEPNTWVTLIYTSGTTGRPKGVMLSHKNILSNVMGCHTRFIMENDEKFRILSILPISHILERMVVYVFMYKCYGIYFAEGIDKLASNFQEVRPNVILVVPRVIEKLYASIYNKGTSSGWIKKQIFLWALNVAKKFEPFKPVSFSHKIADALVFKKWRKAVGNNLQLIICGSAALSENLCRIFNAAGLVITEGYGMTETSPVISVNGRTEDVFRLGTVGPLLNGNEVKIADDGEILTKGPNVFLGYYKDEEKTKEIFTEDGWLKTGDIGYMKDGFLKITDRKKEIFKTSGGKYIIPQVTENKLKQSQFIGEAMVVGDGEKMPCALIQPDFDFIAKYISYKRLPIDSSSPAEIANNKEIKDRIMQEVEKVNKSLGKWEQIKKIELTPSVWSVEGGEFTPTLKLKRKFIKEKYINLYNKLYDK